MSTQSLKKINYFMHGFRIEYIKSCISVDLLIYEVLEGEHLTSSCLFHLEIVFRPSQRQIHPFKDSLFFFLVKKLVIY